MEDLINGLLITDDAVGLELVTEDLVFLNTTEIKITNREMTKTLDIMDISKYEPDDKMTLFSYRELVLVNVLIQYFKKRNKKQVYKRLSQHDVEFIRFFCNSIRLTSNLLPVPQSSKSLKVNNRFYLQKVGATLNIYDTYTALTKGYVKVLYLSTCGMSKENIINLCLNHFIFTDIDIDDCIEIDLYDF